MLKYIIQSYDTLYSIARKFKFTTVQILAINPQIINNNQIYPGQIINIPGFMYEIRPNDTLNKISQKFNLPMNLLISANPQLMYYNNITIGQKIFITSTETQTSIPEEAKKIDSTAKDILEDINNKNWNQAEEKFSIIKDNFNELTPILKTDSFPQSLKDIISEAIINLEKELNMKNVHESKVYAFIITEYIQDILDYFNTEIPADLNNLDYLGREIILNTKKNDWNAASKNLEAIKAIWSDFKLELNFKYKKETADLYPILNSLNNSILNKDYSKTIQEANDLLNEIDTIKESFKTQTKKSPI